MALSWKGFATGATCGLYLFLYCLDYYGSLSSLRPLSFANGARGQTCGVQRRRAPSANSAEGT